MDWVLIYFSHMFLLQGGSDKEKENQLRAEIKQILKEASSLSQ